MTNQRTPVRLLGLAAGLACVVGLVRNPAPVRAQGEPPAPAAKTRRPDLYDTKADARATIATATSRARRDGTRVLVMFGFNACGWCHKLHGLFGSDPAIRKALGENYAVAMIDIAAPHADELLDRCKSALPEDERNRVGYPFLAVLDTTGKVVTAQRTDPLEVGDHHDPAKVKAFLDRFVAPPLVASEVVSSGLARARSEDKRVFLHFGAPWCGWCHKLDDFLAREDVAAILGPDYLDVKVDIDRMTGGKDILARYHTGEGGIPRFSILDADGKALATSDGPNGNIGYPAKPEEIDHFMTMLKTTARRAQPAQLDTIRKLLIEASPRLQPAPAR